MSSVLAALSPEMLDQGVRSTPPCTRETHE
jgi:hypothetical protein